MQTPKTWTCENSEYL